MRFRWSDGVKLWSAAVVAEIQHQQHRSKQLKTVKTSHQEPQQQPEQVDDAALDQAEEAQLRRNIELVCGQFLTEHANGLGIAVKVSVNGSVKFREALGMKDLENREPAEAVDKFKVMIYSVTKPFTAHCWMKFMDENGLNWDNHAVHDVIGNLPTEGYCPIWNKLLSNDDYYKTGSGMGKYEDRWQVVTAQHLLTHTAGLMRDVGGKGDFREYVSSTQAFEKYKRFAQLLNDQPMTSLHYSNYGYDLVGVMLERMQPQSFKNYLRDQLASLNLPNTHPATMEEVFMDEINPGYWSSIDDKFMERAINRNLSIVPASAGLVSDVDQLDRFGNINAQMYKRAYLDNPHRRRNAVQALPISTSKTVMQHASHIVMHYSEDEVEANSAGWSTMRELKCNVAGKRKLKYRMGHSGLGYGSRSQLSVSFHNLDVERAKGSMVLGDQIEPDKFWHGTIKRCQREQPSPKRCITRWELPPGALLQLEWPEEPTKTMVEAEEIKMDMTFDNYHDNAWTFLYLMRNHSALGYDFHFLEQRLFDLLQSRTGQRDLMEIHLERIRRKISRTALSEHRLICNGVQDALSKRELDAYLRISDIFSFEYHTKLIDKLKSYDAKFDRIDRARLSLLRILDDPSEQFDEEAFANRFADNAAQFDVNQPFNVSSDDWAETQHRYHPANPHEDDGGRFDEGELAEEGDCRCALFRQLAIDFASYEQELPDDGCLDDQNQDDGNQDDGNQDYGNQDDGNQDDENQDDGNQDDGCLDDGSQDGDDGNGPVEHTFWDWYNQPGMCHVDITAPDALYPTAEIPASWLRPCEVDGSSRKRRHCGKGERDKMRSVVVSIVANQRSVDLNQLTRTLDDLVAQHYFPVELTSPADDVVDEKARRVKRKRRAGG